MTVRIERTLVYKDPNGHRGEVHEDEVSTIREPVVILGDPGLGKTELTKWLGDQPGLQCVPAGKFERHADPASLIDKGERIVIDGVDEIATGEHGSPVGAVLRQLSKMSCPPFILSCREADWMGAADRAKIKQDYGAAPVLLRLQPFSYEDILAFLSNEFPGIDADGLLDHLDDRGIGSLYENPLTLRMLGEVMQEEGTLPDTRAQLFDRACRVMLEERNPLHEIDAHASQTEDELLVAAGAVCSAQLICDRIAVYTGATKKTPEDCLNVVDVAQLPSGGAARDGLRTRLFQAEGENRFTHIHRAVAEYLGAKWLARCCDEGVSERRIFALFGRANTVSASLRGLYGWIPHFGGPLADRCIETDPYAVLVCGAAETLDLDRVRDLLAALKGLSWIDAEMLSPKWERSPASHLMRVELKDEILYIIENQPFFKPIGELLVKALPGTDLARILESYLVAIAFDCGRYEMVRSYARRMLRAIDASIDWDFEIRRLLQREDCASDWLAWETLAGIGANAVSAGTVLDTVMVSLRLDPTRDAARQSFPIRLDTRFLRQVDACLGAKLLDGLDERVRPTMETAHSSARASIADLVRFLTDRVIEQEPSIGPERVWGWIGWLDGDAAHDSNVRKRLAETFRENGTLRAALLERVLLGPGVDRIGVASGRLEAAGLDLYPSVEDLAGLMRALRERTCDDRVDAETFCGLLLLDRSTGGLPAVLCDAAAEAANGDPELLAIVDDMSDDTDLKRRAEEEERRRQEQAERRRVRQFHQDELAQRLKAIAAGDFEVLGLPAEVYAGLSIRMDSKHLFEPGASPLDSKVSPEDRICAFLGDEMGGKVLGGFVAVLDCDDLPSPGEIVRLHCDGKPWIGRFPMLCGIAEMLRRGFDIGRIDRNTLGAAYMSLQQLWMVPCFKRMGVGDALETALFRNEADWEAHFRTAIEPQLEGKTDRIHELFELTHNPRLAGLAGRLAVEWLCNYPALSPSKLAELLAHALENAHPGLARELVIDRRAQDHPDEETRLFWLSADYVVDFENCREVLNQEAADNPDFLRFILDRIAPPGRHELDRMSTFGFGLNRLSVTQLAFVVEAFGGSWPATPQFVSAAQRDGRDAKDAAEFIEKVISEISGRPSSEATEALQRLSAAGPQGYVEMARQSLQRQRSARRRLEYAAPTVEELRASVRDGLPESIDDMRVWFADRIERLQEQIRGSNTDMWEAYWAGALPKAENFCRNRMIEHLSGQLPDSIRLEPEGHMPGGNRADIVLTRNAIKLPVEIKGQWRRDVWDAAMDQLDAKYAVDWQAKGRGAYIVLWFGDVRDGRLHAHPDGLEQPQTPEALRGMLEDRLLDAQRSLIDIFVIDVSRPDEAK